VKTGLLRIVAGAGLATLSLLISTRAEAQVVDLGTDPPAPEPADVPSAAAPTNLALTGAVVTGVWYGGALGASFIWSNAPWSTEMKIPIAGPWLSLNQLECGNEPECTTLLEVVRIVLVSIDGVGQAAGLAFIAESLFMPSAADKRPAKKSAKLRPFPIVTSNVLGVGVAGEL
jgi:hypothetical protein